MDRVVLGGFIGRLGELRKKRERGLFVAGSDVSPNLLDDPFQRRFPCLIESAPLFALPQALLR